MILKYMYICLRRRVQQSSIFLNTLLNSNFHSDQSSSEELHKQKLGPPWSVLFFGSNNESVKTLEMLYSNLGMLNCHPSLLPRWRGAAPQIHAILHGDKESGVSVVKIKPYKFDIGEVVKQVTTEISPDETAPSLIDRLADLSATTLLQCLHDLPHCLQMAQPQCNVNITYAPKVNSKLARVQWTKMSALEVYNLHRALSYRYSLRTRWHNITVMLYGISLGSNDSEDTTTFHTPGLVQYDCQSECLLVWCADRKHIKVKEVRLDDKNKMSGKTFYIKYLSQVQLCCRTFE